MKTIEMFFFRYSKIFEYTFKSQTYYQTTILLSKLFINPFSTNVPLLCPLKTSENRGFSDVFREYRSGALIENRFLLSKQQRFRHVSCRQNFELNFVFSGRIHGRSEVGFRRFLDFALCTT